VGNQAQQAQQDQHLLEFVQLNGNVLNVEKCKAVRLARLQRWHAPKL
jgi:hypothetical protein